MSVCATTMDLELLNLEGLTLEERTIILNVIRRDDEVKRHQDNRVSQLKGEIHNIRMNGVLRSGDDLSKMCARCKSPFGLVTNTGDICTSCRFKVCKKCRERLLTQGWLCILCFKENQLRWLTGDWMAKDNKKENFHRYNATDLVRASLRVKHTNGNLGGVEERGAHNGNRASPGRVEYPQDSDKKRLSTLFESIKTGLGAGTQEEDQVAAQGAVGGAPAAAAPGERTVQRVSCRRRRDSNSSSNSDSEPEKSSPNRKDLTSSSEMTGSGRKSYIPRYARSQTESAPNSSDTVSGGSDSRLNSLSLSSDASVSTVKEGSIVRVRVREGDEAQQAGGDHKNVPAPHPESVPQARPRNTRRMLPQVGVRPHKNGETVDGKQPAQRAMEGQMEDDRSSGCSFTSSDWGEVTPTDTSHPITPQSSLDKKEETGSAMAQSSGYVSASKKNGEEQEPEPAPRKKQQRRSGTVAPPEDALLSSQPPSKIPVKTEQGREDQAKVTPDKSEPPIQHTDTGEKPPQHPNMHVTTHVRRQSSGRSETLSLGSGRTASPATKMRLLDMASNRAMERDTDSVKSWSGGSDDTMSLGMSCSGMRASPEVPASLTQKVSYKKRAQGGKHESGEDDEVDASVQRVAEWLDSSYRHGAPEAMPDTVPEEPESESKHDEDDEELSQDDLDSAYSSSANTSMQARAGNASFELDDGGTDSKRTTPGTLSPIPPDAVSVEVSSRSSEKADFATELLHKQGGPVAEESKSRQAGKPDLNKESPSDSTVPVWDTDLKKSSSSESPARDVGTGKPVEDIDAMVARMRTPDTDIPYTIQRYFSSDDANSDTLSIISEVTEPGDTMEGDDRTMRDDYDDSSDSDGTLHDDLEGHLSDECADLSDAGPVENDGLSDFASTVDGVPVSREDTSTPVQAEVEELLNASTPDQAEVGGVQQGSKTQEDSENPEDFGHHSSDLKEDEENCSQHDEIPVQEEKGCQTDHHSQVKGQQKYLEDLLVQHKEQEEREGETDLTEDTTQTEDGLLQGDVDSQNKLDLMEDSTQTEKQQMERGQQTSPHLVRHLLPGKRVCFMHDQQVHIIPGDDSEGSDDGGNEGSVEQQEEEEEDGKMAAESDFVRTLLVDELSVKSGAKPEGGLCHEKEIHNTDIDSDGENERSSSLDSSSLNEAIFLDTDEVDAAVRLEDDQEHGACEETAGDLNTEGRSPEEENACGEIDASCSVDQDKSFVEENVVDRVETKSLAVDVSVHRNTKEQESMEINPFAARTRCGPCFQHGPQPVLTAKGLTVEMNGAVSSVDETEHASSAECAMNSDVPVNGDVSVNLVPEQNSLSHDDCACPSSPLGPPPTSTQLSGMCSEAEWANQDSGVSESVCMPSDHSATRPVASGAVENAASTGRNTKTDGSVRSEEDLDGERDGPSEHDLICSGDLNHFDNSSVHSNNFARNTSSATDDLTATNSIEHNSRKSKMTVSVGDVPRHPQQKSKDFFRNTIVHPAFRKALESAGGHTRSDLTKHCLHSSAANQHSQSDSSLEHRLHRSLSLEQRSPTGKVSGQHTLLELLMNKSDLSVTSASSKRSSVDNGSEASSDPDAADNFQIPQIKRQADGDHASGSEYSGHGSPDKQRGSSQHLSPPSIVTSHTGSLDERSCDEDDIDELFAKHRMRSSLGVSRSSLGDSRESLASVYSDAGEINYGRIPVTGEIVFGLDYDHKRSALIITVKQCHDLAPVDTKHNRSDPYVKVYLLPDKTRSGKRKTKIKKHTLSPVYNEQLIYNISRGELENRTLWVTVWHSDRFGRNDFLGEVLIPMDTYRFDDPTPRAYTLQSRMPENVSEEAMQYKGDLVISLMYVSPDKVASEKKSKSKSKKSKSAGEVRGEIHAMIKAAKNLTAVRSSGASDPFVKGYLLPDRTRTGKQKTPVVKNSVNPMWNHILVFEGVDHNDLPNRCLELTVWDHEKLGTNEFLGAARLNLGHGVVKGSQVEWMDARGEEIVAWQKMIDSPNSWIDAHLPLRASMGKPSKK